MKILIGSNVKSQVSTSFSLFGRSLYGIIILLTIGIGLIAGVLGGLFVLEIWIVLLIGFLIFYRPEFGLLIYIFFTITLVNIASLPSIKVPGLGTLYLTDITLIYTLVVCFLRAPRPVWPKNPLVVPMLVYFSTRMVSVLYSGILGANLKDVLAQLFRVELPMLTFFAMLTLLHQRQAWRTILRSLLIWSLGIMLFYLYAAVSRNQALLSLPLFTLRADVNILSGEIPRIVALGQETIYPVFLISLAILLSPAGFKTKLIYGLLFFVAAASIVVNGFRSYWYATAFASVVVFLLSLKVQRKTVEKIFFPVAFFVILAVILAVFFQNFLPQTLLNYMWERASSIFVNGIQDPSASFRLLEWRWGLQKVLERPVFGWGVSFPVKPATLDLGVNNGWLLLHSGYLDLLLYYGFVGILVFIFVYLNSLRYAYNILKRITGASQKSLVVAFLGYMVLLLIVAIANPTFAEAPEVILLNIGFALMVFLGQDVQRNSIIRE